MSPQKRVTITACMLYIVLGFLVCGMSLSREYNPEKSNSQNDEKYDVISVSSEKKNSEIAEPDKYILKILDGIVVVFKESDMIHPILVTDIYASSLRNLDRERLSVGIIADNDFVLQCMLEDYSS